MHIQQSNINSTFQGAYSIGKSPRSNLFEINNSPSPQHYQLNTTDNLKKYNSPKWTISQTGLQISKNNEQQKDEIGPGYYDLSNFSDKMKGTKFKPLVEKIKHIEYTIGPGQYEPKLVKQPKKNNGLNFPGRYDHINIIQTDQSPGPGQYDPKYDKTFSDSFQQLNRKSESDNHYKDILQKKLENSNSRPTNQNHISQQILKKNKYINKLNNLNTSKSTQSIFKYDTQFSEFQIKSANTQQMKQQQNQNQKDPYYEQLKKQYDQIFKNKQNFNREVRFKKKLANNQDDNIGPGQYNIISDIDKYVKDQNKKFTFGQKYESWKYEKYENKPHPGYYNKIYDYNDSKPQFTIPKSQYSPNNIKQSPGPTDYFNENEKNSYFSFKLKNSKKKQTGLTTSMRYQAKILEGPGPQNYQIKRKFNSDIGPVIKENIYQNIANQNKLNPGPGKYIIDSGSQEKNKGITIGKKTKIQQVENISPGVGFYNQKSFFGKNNQAVKFSKGLQLDKLQNSVISEPGPGQYTIGSSFGAIPNYLMQKKQSQQSINSKKLTQQS